MLFQQHARQLLIGFSQRSALAGLALLALAVIGVIVLIFDLVTGRTGAVIAGVAALVLFGSLWASFRSFCDVHVPPTGEITPLTSGEAAADGRPGTPYVPMPGR